MRQTVLSLFLAGALAGVGSVAAAGDLIRAQSPWDEAYGEEYEAPGVQSFGSTRGHFEEGTGSTSWYAPPDYSMFFKAGVQWLSRSNGATDQTLVVELPPLSTPVMSTNDVSLGSQFNPGAIFTLGINFDQVSGVDFVYWGLQNYSNSATVTTATVDFIFADRMSAEYNSQLNNAEANYRQTIEGVTMLAGFRYFSLAETFNINSRNAFTQTSSDYHIDAHNQLVGGQVGLGYGVEWGRFHLGADTKFAVLANLCSQDTLLNDFGNTFTRRNYSDQSTPVSLISDTTVNGKFQVTDWLAVELGYRFMWVQNVALAPNQLDLTDSPAGTKIIDPRSHIYLNGLMLSTEVRW
ncbi:MAG: BBP7 family outer membrane beta-barrel protein [Planctomycetota bacterium]|nr:BBP7 family outer membrane beta-barrel protein [Planctomycetota bacterium]